MMEFPFMSPSESFSHLSLKGSEAARLSDVSGSVEPDGRGRVIFTMNVEFGDGRSQEIVVHECDEPDDLASAFCEQHGLPVQLRQTLSLQIESNIEQVVENQCSSIDESFQKQTLDYYKPTSTDSQARKPKGALTERPKPQSAKVGQRLYDKGVMMKKLMQEEVRRKLQEKQDQEVAELTFSPKILKRDFAERGLLNISLTDRTRSKEFKLRQIRANIEFEELAACSFKPNISEGTRELMKNRGTVSHRLNQLYREGRDQDARRETAARQTLEHTCTFRPEINESPRKSSLAFTSSLTPTKPPRASSRKSASKDDLECSFKPKIGRPPKISRNSEAAPIGTYLHTQQAKRDPPPEESKLSARPSQFTGEHSLKIIDKLRLERYEQIFKAFHKEGSDEVVWDCPEGLEAKLVKVLRPLIDDCAQGGLVYDLPMFSEALDKFAKKLTPIDKSVLYSTGKAPPVPDQPSFRPKITGYNSQGLKARSQLSLYDRLQKDEQKTRSKVNERKIKRIEEEMVECTFYPNTLELSKSLRGRRETPLCSAD
jgi:hypothetical protein